MAAQRIDKAWCDDREHGGFELGWDHARHGLMPPAPHLGADSPISLGWLAGKARFGARTRVANPATRQWLQVRLQAWVHGRSFEPMSVTPHYLGQLAASHCPVTRQPLSHVTRPATDGEPDDAVIARLCGEAGYAAGHLATLSRAADVAKGDLAWFEATHQAQRIDAAGGGRIDGLASDAWRRLGVLLSFVTPLPHAQAARVAMLVLPPNRLHLRNPIQALQVLATRLLARSGWSSRLHALLALMPREIQREDFQRFFLALLARTIEGGQPTDPLRRRWALEDAWRDTEVQQLWWHFALQINADQAQDLITRAAERGLADQRVMVHSDEQTTDGWALATGGFLRRPASAKGDDTGGVVEVPGMPLASPAARTRPAGGMPALAHGSTVFARPRQMQLPWSV